MRRLSLLLLLLVLAWALPALPAEKPFTLTDRAVVPDSVMRLRSTSFPASQSSGVHSQSILLPAWNQLLGPTVPHPFNDTHWEIGRARAKCKVHLYTLVPRTWSQRRLRAYNWQQHSWSSVGLAFQVESARRLSSVKCEGRISGTIRCSDYALATLWRGDGYHGGYCTTGFYLAAGPDSSTPAILRTQPSLQSWDAIVSRPRASQALGVVGTLTTWGGPLTDRQIDTPIVSEATATDWTADSADRPTLVLYPGVWYYVCMALDLRYLSASYGSISDYEIDFSSGDYGAYFDSLEIELEPVKKSAKS